MKANEERIALVREKALKGLRECQGNGDLEAAHEEADQILCDVLQELGFNDIVGEWMKIEKWYE